jgi:hypothetical protein
MKKVVQIYSRKFLGDYSYAQNNERIPDTALFFVGVLLTVALPQIICTAYGGIIPLTAFASSALVGSVLGWVRYRQMPYQALSCVGTRYAPRTPWNKDAMDKKAVTH